MHEMGCAGLRTQRHPSEEHRGSVFRSRSRCGAHGRCSVAALPATHARPAGRAAPGLWWLSTLLPHLAPTFLGPMSVLRLPDSDLPADAVWAGGGVSLSTGLRCDVATEACQLRVCTRAYTHTMGLW